MEKYTTVKGFEGKYEISNLGNIKSLSRDCVLKTSKFKTKELILKKKINPQGYEFIGVGNKKYITVHRLMAVTFIPNPENKRCINHINGIKNDNRLENLEWATHSENSLHAYKIGLKIGVKVQLGKFGKDSFNAKKIIQYTKEGEKVAEYFGTYEIYRMTGFNKGNINQCCNGKRKSSNNYIWKYAPVD